MKETTRKSFVPKNFPKSWVLFVISCLSGMGIGLVTFIAASLEIKVIGYIGTFLFFVCWIVGVVNMFIYLYGWSTGKYHNVEEKEWKDQVW